MQRARLIRVKATRIEFACSKLDISLEGRLVVRSLRIPSRSLLGSIALALAISVLFLTGIKFSRTSQAWAFEQPGSTEFVTARNRRLFKDGQGIRLKSVAFSNHYSFELGENGFDLATSRHHSEQDFKHVKELGFNSVRFAFNGNWYEQDPAGFWRWLDKNIQWAKRNNILLILDLHVPIGGFWLAPTSEKVDFGLWSDQSLIQRNINLWQEIARRYENEAAIAAFEILNEAVTSDATGEQWERFARATVSAIREVDQNHLLIVGALYGTDKKYAEINRSSFFLVDDPNVMYDFHFYKPIEYTHHNSVWVDRPMGDGGSYPDFTTPIPSGQQVFINGSSIGTKRLSSGNSEWTRFESDWVRLTSNDAFAGLPVATLREGASGDVSFDDIAVFEFDARTRRVSKIVSDPLSKETIWQWWDWSNQKPHPESTKFTRSEQQGSNDMASLRIVGSSRRGEYLGWSSDRYWFQATANNMYRIEGFMRGSNVAYPVSQSEGSGYIGLELNFYANPAKTSETGFYFRNEEYLRAEFLKIFQFGLMNNVPISVMEFGVMHSVFDEGRGGEHWIADVLKIFQDYDVSFSLWNYHGASMGLYLSEFGAAPSVPNTKLIDAMKVGLGSQDD